MTMRKDVITCLSPVALLLSVFALQADAQSPVSVHFEADDRIVVVGNTFAERLALSGYFEALVHAAHPQHGLVVRHVPWSGDEVSLRPREHSVPTMEDHLTAYEADVIVLCFGMSESFAGADGIQSFSEKLSELMIRFDPVVYDGVRPPRAIVVSPIAHEDLGSPMMTGSQLLARNADIAKYVEVMRSAAQAANAPFVDLFTASAGIYDREDNPATSNGMHPNELGCFYFAREIGRQLGWIDDAPANGATSPSAQQLRQLAYDKHYHERLLYRPTNTEYVWGRRHEPYGIVNFPPEIEQLKRMIAARDRAMWEMEKPTPAALFATAPNGPAVWETIPSSNDFPEDTWSPGSVEAKGRENSLGDLNILDPDEFAKSFTLPEGYVIECFASEQDFEELANPLAMTFDARGRLWVLCTPTYPHLLPGESPVCHLLILQDTDADGRADQRIVFADQLYFPTGFAIDTDAVYVGQAPDLWKLTDTDGDDRADRREIVASGFGMPDSHHQVSAFEWDPNGGILFHEGVFTKSNVETPLGTLRTHGAAVWRFDPRTQDLQVMSHCNFANPWGHAYDDYGQSVLADASGGDNYSFSHVITPYTYPNKPNRVGRFLNRGRPTAGCELISSRHFPDDVQDSFLVNQSIGFHGTRWDRIFEDGSAWRAESMPQDMLQSSDTNFRPVAMEIGPDGALYIVDWCNPLVGHMQYSVRDPRRDHTHGRIWRIRHQDRPLLDPPTIVGQRVPELLELLRLPERNTRQLARRQLQRTAATDVFHEITKWLAGLDAGDPLRDRFLLESLWIHQAQGRIDLDLLARVAEVENPRARAGAIRVLRHWLQQQVIEPDLALPLLERAVADEDMRVRLEGVLACGFIPSVDGASVAAIAAEADMDEGLRIVLQETLAYLAMYGEPQSEFARQLRLERTSARELLAMTLDDLVAGVVLLRADVPEADRAQALAHLADAEDANHAAYLITAVSEARQPETAVDAAAPVLLGLTAAQLADGADALNDVAENTRGRVQALARAALVKGGAGADVLADADTAVLTEVLEFLDPNQAPDAAVSNLRRHVEAGVMNPTPTLREIARHSSDGDDLFAWLAGLVDAAADRRLNKFDLTQTTAMAALCAMNELPSSLWPSGFEQYRVDRADQAVMAQGRAVYFDEINGCVRCHSADGRGEEGFPPLDRSPWVLGNPERAAAIVIHGLYGQLHLRYGGAFNSVMDPLGAQLDDDQLAAVLTYIRQSWGNYAPPVDAEHVARARTWEGQVNNAPLFVDNVLSRYPLSADGILPVSAMAQGGDASGSNMRAIVLTVALVLVGFVIVIVIINRLTSNARAA